MDILKVSCEFKKAYINLLKVKEAKLRLSMLDQAKSAVDTGIHAGGAYSAVIPLTALYYGGYMNFDVEKPDRIGQDMFVLSKGHAVAALASLYADLGYIDESHLKNTRSIDSIVNGHPGPIFPGVQVSTGPLGEGICVAQGFAMAGKIDGDFDVYAMTGDGELQEGMAWEAFIYAGQTGVSNLCVIVDNNNGQLDAYERLLYPSSLATQIASFNWNVHEVDATDFGGLLGALSAFKYAERNGKPTAIICRSQKGSGSFSNFINKHKINMTEPLYTNETTLLKSLIAKREAKLCACLDELNTDEAAMIIKKAEAMNIKLNTHLMKDYTIEDIPAKVKLKKTTPRDKKIKYDASLLPKLDQSKNYMCADVVRDSMKIFALDERVVSLDSDLASTSGLEAGVAFVDKRRGINVGIAEANMMNIGEAFAALGYNTWASTFCPFFNWQVMRRVAVSYQERLEDMEDPNGWLTQGHGLDLTFLATAANLDTGVNGATHMGNDDIMVMKEVACLKIIDVSCPQQMLSIMRWIMEGNKGMIYLRMMRAASAVIYDSDFKFEYGKGYFVKESGDTVLVSSGRGVHECIAAEKLLQERGIQAAVLDMPSFDQDTLFKLYDQGKKLVFVEQNNGYLLGEFLKACNRAKRSISYDNLKWVNASKDGKPWFIHSATYDEIIRAHGLDPKSIAKLAE